MNLGAEGSPLRGMGLGTKLDMGNWRGKDEWNGLRTRTRNAERHEQDELNGSKRDGGHYWGVKRSVLKCLDEYNMGENRGARGSG